MPIQAFPKVLEVFEWIMFSVFGVKEVTKKIEFEIFCVSPDVNWR